MDHVGLWLHGNNVDRLLGTDAAAPYSLLFNTTTVPDGDYTIQAIGYSTSGQASASAARMVTVNNANLVQITSPSAEGEQVAGLLSVAAGAAPSVSRVEFWLGQTSSEGVLVASDSTVPFGWDIDTTTYANGPRTIRAIAYTSDGMQAAIADARAIVINNPNLLSISGPSSDGTVLSGTTTLSVTAQPSDPDYSSIDLVLSGHNGLKAWTLTNGAREATFDTTSLDDGTYTLSAQAIKPNGMLVVGSYATRSLIIANDHTVCATVHDARALPDGTLCVLLDKAVSAGTGDSMDDAFYIGESDRSSGLRIAWKGPAVPASRAVNVLGSVQNNSSTGEREIDAGDVTMGSTGSAIAPMLMTQLALGGANPSEEVDTNGITGVFGLYNIGQLARICGRVSYVGSDYVFLDDGSNVVDGSGDVCTPVPLDGGDIAQKPVPGVKVRLGSYAKPKLGDYVAVNGTSSMAAVSVGGNTSHVRLLRATGEAESMPGQVYQAAYAWWGGGGQGVFLADAMNFHKYQVGEKVRLSTADVISNEGSYFTAECYFKNTSGWAGVRFDAATSLTTTYTALIVVGTVTCNDGVDVSVAPDAIYVGTVGDPGIGVLSLSGYTTAASAAVAADGYRPWPYPTPEEIVDSQWFQDLYNQSGSIGWALSQPDGSIMDLTNEQVISVSEDGLTLGLKEQFEPIQHAPQVVLVLDHPASQQGLDKASVDIVGGTLVTLANGLRAIVSPSEVYAYTDAKGNLLGIPWIKSAVTGGFESSGSGWPWKVRITP